MRSFTESEFPAKLVLDLTIASQMRPHLDLHGRMRTFGLGREILKQSAKRAERAGVINQVRILPSVIIDYFGEPEARGPDYLSYQLHLWPSHRFQFGIHAGGWVTHDGFRLLAPEINLDLKPRSGEEAQSIFRPGHHTLIEVERMLGIPMESHGWERMEDWCYQLVPGTAPIVFEFDFGLLTALEQRPRIRHPR